MSKTVILAVFGLFAIILIGIIVLKWHNPEMDATFPIAVAGVAMTMAGFLITNFKQVDSQKKLEEVPTKTDIKQATADQTKEIKQVTADQTKTIATIIESSSNSPDK